MEDYRYTIQKERRQLIQRQNFDHVGTVIICENRTAKVAEVAAMTIYGNYCYQWDSTKDIVSVLRATDDYLMDKFLDGHGEKRTLNMETTMEAIGKAYPFMDDDEARRLGSCLGEADLMAWVDLFGYSAADIQRLYVYSYSEAAYLFMERVLPLIRESAAELERMRIGMMV
jgi:hypothetical protein